MRKNTQDKILSDFYRNHTGEWTLLETLAKRKEGWSKKLAFAQKKIDQIDAQAREIVRKARLSTPTKGGKS